MGRLDQKDELTLFCKGFPYDANESEILNLDVFRKATAIDLKQGYGFLSFETEQDAEDCYADRFDAKMDGKNLILDFVGNKSLGTSRGGGDRERGGGRSDHHLTLFCKGLPFDCDERDVLALDVFRRAVSIDIKRGFGYLKFESERDAEDCYEDRFNAKMDGRNLFLDFVGDKSRGTGNKRHAGNGRYDDRGHGGRGRSPPLRYDDRGNKIANGRRDARNDRLTLFCKGLPYDATERDILNLKWFKYAKSCRVIYEHGSSKSKGFCYLEFENERDVDDCYHGRRDCQMGGRPLFLDYCGDKANGGKDAGGYSRQRSSSRTRDRSPFRGRDRRERSRSSPRYR